jgi:hypothetical protein
MGVTVRVTIWPSYASGRHGRNVTAAGDRDGGTVSDHWQPPASELRVRVRQRPQADSEAQLRLTEAAAGRRLRVTCTVIAIMTAAQKWPGHASASDSVTVTDELRPIHDGSDVARCAAGQ